MENDGLLRSMLNKQCNPQINERFVSVNFTPHVLNSILAINAL